MRCSLFLFGVHIEIKKVIICKATKTGRIFDDPVLATSSARLLSFLKSLKRFLVHYDQADAKS